MLNGLMPLLLLAAGGALGAAVVYAFMSVRNRELHMRLELQGDAQERMAMLFKGLSAEALKDNNQQFLTLALENLKQYQQSAEQKLSEKHTAIASALQPVAESLQKMDTKIADIEMKREGAYAELRTLVTSMKDQHVLLQKQTSSLVQTLRAPTSRGQWGEMQLKRVLDFSGLLEGIHYTRQSTGASGLRPDILIQLPPDKVLLVDAKVPMQNYLSAMQESVTDDDKNVFLTKHALDLKEHIKRLSGKEYTQDYNSFDWVVLFVPLEGLIQMALDKQPDLMEFAWQKNVILATPASLLALTRTVAYAHDQFKVNENAREIARLGEELYKRIAKFAEHMGKVGRGLTTATNSYNEAVGSLERNVLSSMRKMREIGTTKAEVKELEVPLIEHNVRPLNELMEEEV